MIIKIRNQMSYCLMLIDYFIKKSLWTSVEGDVSYKSLWSAQITSPEVRVSIPEMDTTLADEMLRLELDMY